MELIDNPEFAGYPAVFIPDFYTELFQVQHAVIIFLRHQPEQVFVDETPGNKLGMVFNEVVDSPAHPFMNEWYVSPGVVDARPGPAAAEGVGFFYNGDSDTIFAGFNPSHATGQSAADDKYISI